ncbi:MAG: hypothetical protein ACE5NP_01240 [Anaerolineae bacterium]
MSKSYTFRCYAYRHGEWWYADCLDLMLLVKRQTLQAAMQTLEDQVILYLESVFERGDEDEAIPRPAPLSNWLHFRKHQLIYLVRSLLTGHEDGFISYELQTEPGILKLVYA